MAVIVTHNQATNTLEFRCQTAEDNHVAEYLNKLVGDARAYASAADSGTVAKSGLTGIAFIRKAQEDKIEALTKQAEIWEERSRDWSMQWDIRDLNAQRARQAREEVRKLAQELGL
jgi:hypothetical protein